VALLHIQPPLYNLWVGVVLRWSPFSAAFTFQVASFACGVVLVLATRLLLVELGFAPWAATAAACVVAADPILLAYENTITYEYFTATLLVCSAVMCARCVRTRRLSPFAWFVGLLTVVVLTRALFHPVYLVLSVAFVMWVARPRAAWKWILAVLALPVVLTGGWLLKNEVLFSHATLSSWFGSNLTRGVINVMPRDDVAALVRDGTITAKTDQGLLLPNLTPEQARARCHTSFRQPVLRSLTKSDGSTNYNAACLLPVYDEAQRNALRAVEHRPAAYLSSRGAAIAAHWQLPGDSALAPGIDPFRHNSVLHVLDDVYRPALLPVRVVIDERNWSLPQFGPGRYPADVSLVLMLATLLVIARGVAAAIALARRRTAADATWVFVGFTVAFVTIVSIATEFGENERFRVMIDPILVGVVVAQLLAWADWLRRRAARQA